MNVLYFVLMMGVIIFIHELGHFLTAKKFGVYCAEFALGMGPTLLKKKVGETTYALRLLPVGGFVQMAGEEGTDFDVPFERTVKGIKPWQQVVVMVAGSFMNIVLAFVVFVGIFAYRGEVPVYGPAQIVDIVPGGAADEAGMQVDDIVTKMTFTDGSSTTIDDMMEFSSALSLHTDAIVMEIDRDGQMLSLTMTPRFIEAENRYMIGITLPEVGSKQIAWYESIAYGAQEVWSQTQAIFTTLGNLIRGIGLQNLAGPLGIFDMTSQSVQAGFIVFINLLGLLSLNIGIFNLLPLPVLDGGRILMVAIEKVTGRKISQKVELAIMGAGVFLLVALMLFVTWNDIVRLFG
ncbi:MAG: RIP metalloprotease RseP [Erysipelotrichaceae bacterium]